MLREQRGQRYPPDKRNSCAAAGTLTYICRPWHRAQLSLLKASNIPWKCTCRLDQSGQVLSIGSSDLELTEWYRGHCLKRSGMNGISNSDAFILRRRLQPSSSQPLGLRITVPAEPASAPQSTQDWVFHHGADDIGGCPGM